VQYLVFASLTDFFEVNNVMNEQFGYPTPDNLTTAYAIPIYHPTSGAIAMPIEPRCLPLLSADQAALIKDEFYMFSNGWFSKGVV
jgi:hypothetical protein